MGEKEQEFFCFVYISETHIQEKNVDSVEKRKCVCISVYLFHLCVFFLNQSKFPVFLALTDYTRFVEENTARKVGS